VSETVVELDIDPTVLAMLGPEVDAWAWFEWAGGRVTTVARSRWRLLSPTTFKLLAPFTTKVIRPASAPRLWILLEGVQVETSFAPWFAVQPRDTIQVAP
jgi:hypothetical protein